MRRTATSAAFCVCAPLCARRCAKRRMVHRPGLSAGIPRSSCRGSRSWLGRKGEARPCVRQERIGLSGAGAARSLLPLPIDLVLFLLVHLLNLRIGAGLPGGLGGRRRRGVGVGKRVLLRRGGARGGGRRGGVALGERAVVVMKKAPDSNETASAFEMLVIDLLLSDRWKRREAAQCSVLKPPIACRAEGCGYAFRSRRRSRSSAPVRTAEHRARRRRSAACRVRAARCRRWSPEGIRPS